MAAERRLAPPPRPTTPLKMAARKGRRPGRSAPARRGPECSEIPGGRGEEEVAARGGCERGRLRGVRRCLSGTEEEGGFPPGNELNKNPVEGFSAGLIDDNDLYRWEVLIIGPPDTLYEGGVFKAHLTFPKDYPLRPPKMKFITEIWHPNVDKNGDVCISILHEPGEDKYGYEKPEERWLPIHTVETIMISVISMLADPNGDSPANVDAAKEWREDRNGEFKRKVARCVRKSQETAFE
ncbi:PREDICTED: ubiquitin-conjugating enzyme E2 G1 [Aptenodytes forsteri]|uniref:ubiquitin-conjugating enzyme E2 G1 n=1 Tax=Aptenodytes forsteri TaxID=9233 RepID=UPI000904EDBF|nr:PREDICTED: ubiquitin-conjugating enzyme E2 G1 [Aptenodytes forsteri]